MRYIPDSIEKTLTALGATRVDLPTGRNYIRRVLALLPPTLQNWGLATAAHSRIW